MCGYHAAHAALGRDVLSNWFAGLDFGASDGNIFFMETNPKQLAASLHDHLLTRILPFWANNSIDRRCGGYITNLARDGSPGEGIQKFLVMQARMLDAFNRRSFA